MATDLEAVAKCRVPLWSGFGSPDGYCGKPAYGEQYPREVLRERGWHDRPPYCFGPCCPTHGGPKADEPRIFQDGYTQEGRPLWCAVMPDFVNLQESPAGFDGDGRVALLNLHAAKAQVTP